MKTTNEINLTEIFRELREKGELPSQLRRAAREYGTLLFAHGGISSGKSFDAMETQLAKLIQKMSQSGYERDDIFQLVEIILGSAKG